VEKVFVRELRNHGGDVLNRVLSANFEAIPFNAATARALAGVAASLPSAGRKPAAGRTTP